MKPGILLVDFTPSSREPTRRLLEEAGYPVRVATSRDEVDEAVAAGNFRVAVIEPVIPPIDGFELCRRLKRGSARPPVVILASRVFRGPRFKNMARASGCDAFLERPQQENLLVPALERLVPQTASPPAAPTAPAKAPVARPEAIPSGAPQPASAAPVPAAAPAEPAPARQPQAAPAAAMPEPAPLPMGQALDLSELTGIADDEIEDAFERIVGGDTGQAESAGAPAPTAGPPTAAAAAPPASTPDDGSFLAELRALPLDFAGDAVGAAEDDPLAGTRFPDDHAERIAGPDSEPHARVLASPNQFGEDEAVAPADGPASGADEGKLEFDSEIAALADTAPTGLVGDDALDLPLDLEAATGAGSSAATGPEPGAQALPAEVLDEAADPAALEQRLDAIFRGEIRFEEEETGGSSGPVSGPAAGPVPDSLRGMDASTADLLSSLAELEDSIPQQLADDPGDAVVDSGGFDGTGSIPIPPPPRSEDELTLEEIFSRVSEPASVGVTPPPTAVEPAEPDADPAADEHLSSAPVHAVAISDRLERIDDPAPELAAEPADGPVAAEERGWRRWFTFSLVLVALIGVGGASAVLWWRQAEASAERTLADLRGPGTIGEAPAPDAPRATDADTVDQAATPSGPPSDEAVEALAQTRRPLAELPAAGPEAAEPPPAAAARPAAGADAAPVTARREPIALREPPRPAPVEAAERAPAPAGGQGGTLPAARAEETPEPPPPSAAAPVVPLGALDEPVERLEAPLPFLTEEAARLGIRERAFVNVLIGPDGRVEDVELLRDPGHGLGERAVESARRWRYTAPRRAGAPVRVWKTEGLSFLKPVD
ncbi:MAG: response regulator [Acidobacteria bacterium]|nr:MAG: response regulator [Acidobacteriota bacterium]